MALWQCSIALVLGLVWYLSDCGRTVSQYLVCLVLCLCSPLLFGNSGRESGTQTDEECEEPPLQLADEEVNQMERPTESELLETQYPLAKKSLQQVFECAYTQLVVPWYTVPEPCQEQPLHQALSREVDFVIDRIIERARDLDVCQVVVGSIRILTQHLHNAKQSDRELLFGSRAEEIASLREFADVLVRHLFPESLWGQEVNRCALSEIIAVKGLGLLVTWLSDPDNLNQLVVSQLDSVSPQSSTSELYGLDPDLISLASQEEAAEESSEVGLNGAKISNGIRIKGKRKCSKLKKGWSKFMDKMKSKKSKKEKMKKMEHELVRRIMSIQCDVSTEDDASSREGSVNTQEDSDKEDSDLENYLASVQEDMMEFKLSYEMWRVGRWTVSISHADWEDEQLTFTVHLEEKDSPENLQWDIKKTYMDVIHFRNRWQDSTSLPDILTLDESDIKKEQIEQVRVSVQHFLQELVLDALIGHTQPVFQFLCPLDKLLNEEEHYGGVWGLLSGLAYFLTPGYEEEEICISQLEDDRDSMSSRDAETAALSLGNQSSSAKKGVEYSGAPPPTITFSLETKPEAAEEAATQRDPQATVNTNSCPQGQTENSDNTLTSHLKAMIKGLRRYRSQESLGSTKSDDEESSESDCSQDKGFQHHSTEGSSWLQHLSTKAHKKEKVSFRVSAGKAQIKETQTTLQRGEESQCHKGHVNWEQLEATKALFDLLKEISGNSIMLNIFDAILKPVMPILKKKVNSFLNKMNPSEAQMAAFIDTLRKKQWPESPSATPSPSRTDEQKDETRERAHNLINTKYSNILVLKKTDVEWVFNLFQEREENKTLVYMLLSFLLKELLPNQQSLNVSTAALHKVTNSVS